jgi:hypothetical protein
MLRCVSRFSRSLFISVSLPEEFLLQRGVNLSTPDGGNEPRDSMNVFMNTTNTTNILNQIATLSASHFREVV